MVIVTNPDDFTITNKEVHGRVFFSTQPIKDNATSFQANAVRLSFTKYELLPSTDNLCQEGN